jgi:hypothetical protein
LEATKDLHVIPVIEIPRVAQVIDRDIENEPSRPPEVRGGHPETTVQKQQQSGVQLGST